MHSRTLALTVAGGLAVSLLAVALFVGPWNALGAAMTLALYLVTHAR